MRGGASKAFHGAENVRGREIQNTERRREGETVVFMENPQNIVTFARSAMKSARLHGTRLPYVQAQQKSSVWR